MFKTHPIKGDPKFVILYHKARFCCLCRGESCRKPLHLSLQPLSLNLPSPRALDQTFSWVLKFRFLMISLPRYGHVYVFIKEIYPFQFLKFSHHITSQSYFFHFIICAMLPTDSFHSYWSTISKDAQFHSTSSPWNGEPYPIKSETFHHGPIILNFTICNS